MRASNIKVVGFFGQSGAGKTTTIRNVSTVIDGKLVLPNTGIIRYLFQKNDYYVSPAELLARYESDIAKLKGQEKNAKIDEVYEKYVRSQLQLLNDFSTEVFLFCREPAAKESILLVDRSPIDFYVLTLCGIDWLKKALGRGPNATVKHFIELTRKTAEINTKNFFDAIIVTYPWETQTDRALIDGVRDQYLSPEYVGKNWYGKMNDIKLTNTKVFSIQGSVIDLIERAKLVESYIGEI